MVELTQWVAVFIACGPYNICAVQNEPQPYWSQSECQLSIETVVDANKDTIPPEFKLDGMCLQIHAGKPI